MTTDFPPLLGYADRLSVRAGETVAVKVSSYLKGRYTARLVRNICADPNPKGIGLTEASLTSDFSGSYQARIQPFFPGSSAEIALPPKPAFPKIFTLTAMVWPTRLESGKQVVFSIGNADSGPGLMLGLAEDGHPWVAARLADGDWAEVILKGSLGERRWARLSVDVNSLTNTLTLQAQSGETREASHVVSDKPIALSTETPDSLIIAAAHTPGPRLNFNGKIEGPAIQESNFKPDESEWGQSQNALFAQWDFSKRISSNQIFDIGPHQLHGELVNFPARAMRGSNWDGSEMCWRHAPDQYGAIHFHEDDIYDFNWDTDFLFHVPKELQPGVYGIRLEQEEFQDTIPLFVCPPQGQRTARICVLVSTFTYTVYGNHARPDYDPSWKEKIEAWDAYPWNPAEYPHYGCSTYNFHSDGSGICHASHQRPLFNLRPGYLTFGASACSGLRHFQADSHLIAWLEHQGYDYDIVTDRELHDEGVSAIAGYALVTTGSHPEYHTPETLDALLQYRDQGGHLCYLGGNGFYWRVAVHTENPSLIEIRRAEGGIRAWASEPGEYYNAFDGQYGGLWRRNGRPPQALVGVGFSSQGRFYGSYYRRTPESYDARFAWMFEGIDDELIGDFGFSGGGAAGFELDRYDHFLGSPENAVVLASSENHNDTFVVVPEEKLTHTANAAGVSDTELIRADIVYFETPAGGAVFATGSITFCGSLPHNGFKNNVSGLLGNVFDRFLGVRQKTTEKA